jgi:Na+-transporting methylmalonyl-CoA/oxaloacetate decarboxylase gamma subunit
MVLNDCSPDGHLTVGTGFSVLVLVLAWVVIVCEYLVRNMQGVGRFVVKSMPRGQGMDGIEE